MTQTMILTRGLPGSGKTTFANNWVKEDPSHRINVNRDDIRETLGYTAPCTFEQEKHVNTVQRNLVTAALDAGKSIIISDTHLRSRHIVNWFIVAINHNIDADIIDIIVDIDEIIHRDKNRDMPVGEDRIRDLNTRFPHKYWESKSVLMSRAFKKLSSSDNDTVVANNDPSKPLAIVFDIDGTLAEHVSRSPYDLDKVKEDAVHEPVKRALIAHKNNGATIILCSGRKATSRTLTEEWLAENEIPYDHLLMRGADDERPDDIIKRDIVVNDIVPHYFIGGWYDDRNRVVNEIRRLVPNTMVFQVAPGDF